MTKKKYGTQRYWGPAKVNPSVLRFHLKKWEAKVSMSKPRFLQCKHLIEKFGGILPFATATGWHPNIIIRHWIGGRSQGLVPHDELAKLILTARYWGILLHPHDIYPDLIDKTDVKPLIQNEELKTWHRTLQPTASLRLLEDKIASLVSTPE